MPSVRPMGSPHQHPLPPACNHQQQQGMQGTQTQAVQLLKRQVQQQQEEHRELAAAAAAVLEEVGRVVVLWPVLEGAALVGSPVSTALAP